MNNPNALLHRRDVVNELLRDRADLLVIAGLGAPNWDLSAAGDHPKDGSESQHPMHAMGEEVGRRGRRGRRDQRAWASAARRQRR